MTAPNPAFPNQSWRRWSKDVTVRPWAELECLVVWSTDSPEICAQSSSPPRRPCQRGWTSHLWPGTSSSAGLKTLSKRKPENAASAEPAKNWKKGSVGPAVGQGASTGSAPAHSRRRSDPNPRSPRAEVPFCSGLSPGVVRPLRPTPACGSYRGGGPRRTRQDQCPGSRRWPGSRWCQSECQSATRAASR